MSTIETILLIVHTFIAVLIIALVLLQRGKGADAGAAFGSGASGTVFGARGSSSFFSRATAILATAFFASSLALAWFSSQDAGMPDSLIESAPAGTAPAEDARDSGAPAETPELPQDDTPSTETPSGLPELVPAEPPPEEAPDDEADPGREP